MNKIRMEYDPYQQEISYQFYGSLGWQQLSDGNPLAVDKFQKTSLQSSVDEILKKIIQNYATNAEHSVHITFCGTEEDFEDLTDAIKRNPDVKNGSAKVEVEKDADSYFEAASAAAGKIDEVFKALEDEFCQSQDDEVKATLDQYDDATSNAIPICVMGLYSSGKSMFINALIGEEILPSASDPLTAQIFKVIPGADYQVTFSCRNTKLHFEIVEKEVRLTNSEDCSQCSEWIKAMTEISGSTNAEIMYRMLSALNDPSKSDNKEYSSIDGLISIVVPFQNSKLPTDKIHFEIYDTPGSDSENHKEHFEVLKEALKERTNGLPVLVTKKTDLDRNGIEKLLNKLNATEVKLDRENLVILINQADQESHSDLDDFHKNPPEAAVTKQKKSSILFLSSAVALGCKKAGDGKKWNDDRCRKAYKDNKIHFSDPSDEDYMSLPQYSVLLQNRYDDICKRAKQVEGAVMAGDTGADILRELIAQNSGIRAVEYEITYYAQRFANYNKCRTATGFLSDAIDKTKAKVEDERENVKTIRSDLSAKRTCAKNQLVAELEHTGKSVCNKAGSEAPLYLATRRKETNQIKTQAEHDIEKLYGEHRRDKDFAELQKKINRAFSEYAHVYRDKILNLSRQYWKEQESILKERLIGIVNGNQSISEEEKRILTDCIEYSNNAVPPIYFRIQTKNVVRDKKFLFFTIGQKFDLAKCQAEFLQAFEDDCHGVVNQVSKEHGKQFKAWCDRLVYAVTDRLDEFNEKLRDLNTQLGQAERQLESLESRERHLQNAQEEIQNVLSRQEVSQ